MAKSTGQTLLEKIESWLSSFIVFPNEHMAIVAALWAVNTWMFDAFDAVPYLAVTASTKRAGKTTLLELLSFLSRNAERIGVGTMAPTVYALIESHDTQTTLFFDEAEKMSSGTATLMRGLMNAGYRRGETVPRKEKGQIVKIRCYCPKLFALIGDPTETLRDRSILFVMERALSPRPYRPTYAVAESLALVAEIREMVAYLKAHPIKTGIVAPAWLENRDQEIWEPLWNVALAFKCDRTFLERVQSASSWLVAGKGAEIRRFDATAESEAAWESTTNGERAIRDLAAIFKDGEKYVRTTDAIQRMKAIPTAPWANYRGVGLDAMSLAALILPTGVRPTTLGVRFVDADGVKRQAKGYSRKNVMASVPKVDAQ